MTDFALITMTGAILGAIQGACTGWIHYQVNKNACGGAKCVKTMQDALSFDSTEAAHGYSNMSGQEKS